VLVDERPQLCEARAHLAADPIEQIKHGRDPLADDGRRWIRPLSVLKIYAP
jgi:hypothetical protein